MEPLRLKFAIQGLDDRLSGAKETTVEQITPDWIRFSAAADLLESPGVDPMSTFIKQFRIVMFIYLKAKDEPIQASGRISLCEPSATEPQEKYSVVAEFQEIAEEDRQKIKNYLEVHQGPEVKDRRRQIRRRVDTFVQELRDMLGILAEMSRGRKVEFGEHFANLVGLKNSLGRRLEDRKNGEAICSFIEELASNLAQHFGKETGLRHVKIRKVTGKAQAVVAMDRVLSGWEEAPPQVGKIYCLYLHGGGLFRSTPVTQVQEYHFRTRNSLYEIQEIKP
jgi:hypothetical protein